MPLLPSSGLESYEDFPALIPTFLLSTIVHYFLFNELKMQNSVAEVTAVFFFWGGGVVYVYGVYS